MHKGKINRHEKVAAVLLSGKPTAVEDIKSVFKDTDQEKVLYRLSTNIYNIRKDGGVIKVYKDGRSVTAYQLVNADEFDKNGRYVGPQPKKVKTPKVAPVQVQHQVVEPAPETTEEVTSE